MFLSVRVLQYSAVEFFFKCGFSLSSFSKTVDAVRPSPIKEGPVSLKLHDFKAHLFNPLYFPFAIIV